MKKLFISLFVLLFVVVIAGTGALYYIKPEQKLDLSYRNVTWKELALDMVSRQSTELVLTGDDLNNLAKKSLADNPLVEKDIVVTGADFNLEGALLIANLNMVWKNRVSAGLQVTYSLRWENPNVIATVVKAQVKGLSLPTSAFSDRVIPVGKELPKVLKIKNLVWGGNEVKVQFKKPSIKDLQEIIW